MWSGGFFPTHEGYANKILIKISIQKNLESERTAFNLACLMCQRVLLCVWVDEKKSFSEVYIGCQMSVLSWKHLYYK